THDELQSGNPTQNVTGFFVVLPLMHWANKLLGILRQQWLWMSQNVRMFNELTEQAIILKIGYSNSAILSAILK
ncbi:unnamed protein product, partial [marine sediment metagenome]